MRESITQGLILCLFLTGTLIIFGVPLLIGQEYELVYVSVNVLYISQAVLLMAGPAFLGALVTYYSGVHGKFLTQLFMAALLVRMLVGGTIFAFSGQDFFGGDAYTYDLYGHLQMHAWNNDQYSVYVTNVYLARPGAAWGMIYFVAAIYV